MSLDERERLVDLLRKNHKRTHRVISWRDLDRQVYPDSDWRVRDVLGHIATWDRLAIKSLEAFQNGTEYALPDHDEDAFNIQDVMNQQGLTAKAVFDEWECARLDFIETIKQIPLDSFPGDLLYPWGDERGTIARLVEEMVEHESEHREAISKVLSSLS